MTRNIIVMYLAALLPVTASADHWGEDATLRLISTTLASATARGYYPERSPIIGAIQGSSTVSFIMMFKPNTDYMLIGTGDDDCRDLALIVSDQRHNQIAIDEKPGNQSIVYLKTGGIYQVDVRLRECSKPICHYGLGVFEKTGG